MTRTTDIATEDLVLEGPHGPLAVRVYRPTSPRGPGLVWAHGGGFAGGDLQMPEADAVATQLAERGIVVVSVDYQRAPLPQAWADAMGVESTAGVRYPVASEEVSAAFGWAAGSGLATSSWALGGASAGANLATGAALRLVDGAGPAPALVVLAYPTLHAVQGEPSADLRRALDADPAADVFGPEAVLGMYENYLGGPIDDATPLYAVPGNATPIELAGFPPTIIVNSEVDELRVSGEAFAATLAAAGVDVDVVTEAGTTHGHLNQPDHPGATATLDRFAARILALAP